MQTIINSLFQDNYIQYIHGINTNVMRVLKKQLQFDTNLN